MEMAPGSEPGGCRFESCRTQITFPPCPGVLGSGERRPGPRGEVLQRRARRGQVRGRRHPGKAVNEILR